MWRQTRASGHPARHNPTLVYTFSLASVVIGQTLVVATDQGVDSNTSPRLSLTLTHCPLGPTAKTCISSVLQSIHVLKAGSPGETAERWKARVKRVEAFRSLGLCPHRKQQNPALSLLQLVIPTRSLAGLLCHWLPTTGPSLTGTPAWGLLHGYSSLTLTPTFIVSWNPVLLPSFHSTHQTSWGLTEGQKA